MVSEIYHLIFFSKKLNLLTERFFYGFSHILSKQLVNKEKLFCSTQKKSLTKKIIARGFFIHKVFAHGIMRNFSMMSVCIYLYMHSAQTHTCNLGLSRCLTCSGPRESNSLEVWERGRLPLSSLIPLPFPLNLSVSRDVGLSFLACVCMRARKQRVPKIIEQEDDSFNFGNYIYVYRETKKKIKVSYAIRWQERVGVSWRSGTRRGEFRKFARRQFFTGAIFRPVAASAAAEKVRKYTEALKVVLHHKNIIV